MSLDSVRSAEFQRLLLQPLDGHRKKHNEALFVGSDLLHPPWRCLTRVSKHSPNIVSQSSAVERYGELPARHLHGLARRQTSRESRPFLTRLERSLRWKEATETLYIISDAKRGRLVSL